LKRKRCPALSHFSLIPYQMPPRPHPCCKKTGCYLQQVGLSVSNRSMQQTTSPLHPHVANNSTEGCLFGLILTFCREIIGDCTASIGSAVTYIYRRHTDYKPWRIRKTTKETYTDMFISTPPAVEGSAATQRLDRNLEKVKVGSPFVMMSANC
jgi:hypothetical protein